MYRLAFTKKFKKQVKKLERSGRYDISKLNFIINILARGEVLAEKFRDHGLQGKLHDYRECHIESDWLLMYRKYEDTFVLELFATGSHSELF